MLGRDRLCLCRFRTPQESGSDVDRRGWSGGRGCKGNDADEISEGLKDVHGRGAWFLRRSASAHGG